MAYLLRAGDKAREDYALDEAIAHYRALLPLLERRGHGREMALVLFKLAIALHTSMRFAESNEAYGRAFEHWTPPEPSQLPPTSLQDGVDRPPQARRSGAGDRVDRHPARHAGVRPSRGGLARAHDRALARRALGDLRRRPALRLPPPPGSDVVGWDTPDRTRRRVRDQEAARPEGSGRVGGDLLRARRGAGLLPRAPRRLWTGSGSAPSTT